MTDNQRLNVLLDFMKLPDGSPLVTVNMIDWLTKNGFFYAPASTKYHGNYEGGLFNHSLSVAKHLVGLTESCQLKWKDCRSPYLVGMFHDLCKIDQYRPERQGVTLDGTIIEDPLPPLTRICAGLPECSMTSYRSDTRSSLRTLRCEP